MPYPQSADEHIELLHTYHLDLWNEIETQLRVLRTAQEEIGKLRLSRNKGEPYGVALFAAQLLARHVQILKGRVHSMAGSIDELETTVNGLIEILETAK
jgi:hypothetical protein